MDLFEMEMAAAKVPQLEAENARLREELESEKQYAVIVEYHEVTIRNLREELAAAQLDAARLDFVEAHPGWLRHHKRYWCCVNPSTNYEYSVFSTAREAIDSAMKGEQS